MNKYIPWQLREGLHPITVQVADVADPVEFPNIALAVDLARRLREARRD